MRNLENLENHNLKVLGALVRVNRVKLGYSLRSLAQLTNISHTLISSFEQGKIIPHKDTIQDIFRVLDLDFYTDPDILNRFNILYNKAFKHILFYEYREAKKVIDEIEKEKAIFENSVVAINYEIIRSFFYTISNSLFKEIDTVLENYEVVLSFLTPNQKQLYFFIKGLNHINNMHFYQARKNFEYALELGDKNLDLMIREYYVISLSKSNKYVDAEKIALASISKYEQQTNYIRAMRLRSLIAHIYYRINKFEESEKLYNQILDFSIRFKVEELMDLCYSRLSHLSLIKSDYKAAQKYLDKVTMKYNTICYYIKFDLVFRERDDEKSLKLYNEYINLDWVQKSLKTKLFFELILMRYDEKFMDKDKYEDNLTRLIEMGLEADDGEMIEVSCNMLSSFYQKDRKYKLAYETQQILLNYNKNGITESDYDPGVVFRIRK